MHIKTIRDAIEFELDHNFVVTIQERKQVLECARDEFDSLDCPCGWEQTGMCSWDHWVDETLSQFRGIK
jgi:hypothetical protein